MWPTHSQAHRPSPSAFLGVPLADPPVRGGGSSRSPVTQHPSRTSDPGGEGDAGDVVRQLCAVIVDNVRRLQELGPLPAQLEPGAGPVRAKEDERVGLVCHGWVLSVAGGSCLSRVCLVCRGWVLSVWVLSVWVLSVAYSSGVSRLFIGELFRAGWEG